MGWRFRKVFELFPGLKLNLTPRGISATLGAAPFSLNVGPRGVYRNLSIPGKGIWDRRRLDVPSKHSQEPTTLKDLDQERVERIEMLRKGRQAIKEYGEAHAKLVRLNAALLFGGKGGETVFPAKKFMEYQLVVSAFFAAAKHHEQCNGMFLPESLREKFYCWLVQLETIWADLIARAIKREEVGTALGAFVAVSGPEGGGQISLDFMNAVADYFEALTASLELIEAVKDQRKLK